MQYLTQPADIRSLVTQIASANILWLDTEVADYNTPSPRLSLIQVLASPTDLTGELVYILDVLDKPDLVKYFVNQIVANPNIEKVFHNADFDLRFLEKHRSRHVTCTLKIARKIPLEVLRSPNRQLKTLAEKLCQFSDINKEEQTSDWGRRPLSSEQLKYAKMDPVFLAGVHQRLLEINRGEVDPKPVKYPHFSVTNVRVAFECPRLFYLGQRFGGSTLFSPSGNVTGIGNAFHDLSDRFVNVALHSSQINALFSPAADKLQVETVATQMRQLFYDLVFYSYLQETTSSAPAKAPALHQLWQGLSGLIQRWAELLVQNRRYCSASEVISKTFLAQELSVQHDFNLPDGIQQLVKGRFDSLVYDFERHRLCVIEYKTYQSVDRSAQLAQVALYSYMLRKKVGVPIDSAVYGVLPDWQELTFSWEQLENTVHRLIPHKLQQMQHWLKWEPPSPNPPPPTSQTELLCDICPQQKKCQSFFTEVDKIQPKSAKVEDIDKESEKPVEPSYNADEIGEKLVAILNSFKIKVDYQGTEIGPAFIRVKLKPHLGVKVVSITRLGDDLRVQMGLASTPIIAPSAGYVSVDLPRTDRQIARFEEYVQPQISSPTDSIKIALGVDLEGQLVEAELSEPNTCHFLVGGTTGSGKSELLRSLLLSLLLRHSPSQLKIALVDPKRVTFPEFEQMPWLYSPIVKDSARAIKLMNQLVAEMAGRYQQFEQASCPDITAYNRHAAQPLPRIVCIFDEYADFMAETEPRNALELSIKRLGAMARAAGVHLIIATQRPEAKIVTPLIRSNLPGRVALRTASVADSMIILGGKQTEAAYLLGKGDLLYQAGASLLRLQSLFATTIHLPSAS